MTKESKKEFIRTAITLARLYGIAETLHPWDYVENEAFISKIKDWTEEFMNSGSGDILKFFEKKIIQ